MDNLEQAIKRLKRFIEGVEEQGTMKVAPFLCGMGRKG
jgi:ribosomal protein S21